MHTNFECCGASLPLNRIVRDGLGWSIVTRRKLGHWYCVDRVVDEKEVDSLFYRDWAVFEHELEVNGICIKEHVYDTIQSESRGIV